MIALGLLVVIVMSALIFAVLYFSTIALVKVAGGMLDGAGSGRVPVTTRNALRDARQYAGMIRKTAKQCPPGLVSDRLNRTAQPVDDWLDDLKRLEQALGRLYGQRNLTREMRRTGVELEQLRRDIVLATTNNEIATLRSLLKSKKKHFAVLEELKAFQTQSELKIRKIASDLGATHAEMLLVVARGDFNEGRFRRMDENLQENMSGLRDIISVMDEMGYTTSAAVN
jgi:hypothetical protein